METGTSSTSAGSDRLISRALPNRLIFYEGHPSEILDATNDRVIARLTEAKVEASWTRTIPEDLGAGDVFIAHLPFRSPYPMPDVCLRGMRLTNRRQRLTLCDRIGAPVATWANPPDADGVAALFDEWGVDELLLKRDRSYRRAGIERIKRGQPIPTYDPDADVFMRVLRGDPRTFKVATFYDTPIAARVLGTRAIDDPEFVSALSTQFLHFPPDQELLDIAAKVGRAFHDMGAGYMCVDFMREDDRWLIIEVNPGGVGRRTSWRLWPGLYGDRYALGVLSWLDSGPEFEPITTMIERAKTL